MEHRLYKGDCLEVMDKLIETGVKVDLVLTDPPYGLTVCQWDSILRFDDMWERLHKLCNSNTPIVLFGSEPFSSLLRCSNIEEYKYDWIWDKEQGTNQFMKNKQPLRKHENISVFYKEQCMFNNVKIHSWRREIKFRQETNNEIIGYEGKEKTSYDSKGLKHPVTILPFNRPHWREGRFHSTQKPTLLLQYLIQTYTNEGMSVLDFTMGSNSTGIACLDTNRNYIGIELDDKYFQVAKNRTKEYIKSKNIDVDITIFE